MVRIHRVFGEHHHVIEHAGVNCHLLDVASHAALRAQQNGAELVELSGKRNPYPGKLGVIEKDAMADLLIVNGNPLEDISLLGDPESNLLLIMKDGKIYKNTLAE